MALNYRALLTNSVFNVSSSCENNEEKVPDSDLFNSEPLISSVPGICSNTEIRKDAPVTVLCSFVELSSTEPGRSLPSNIAASVCSSDNVTSIENDSESVLHDRLDAEKKVSADFNT